MGDEIWDKTWALLTIGSLLIILGAILATYITEVLRFKKYQGK